METPQFTYNGQPYDFKILLKNMQKAKAKLPRAMGQVAVNFFKDRFREQGWNRTGVLIPWRRRKAAQKGRKRAILVKSGAMRNRTRIEQASFERTSIVNDQKYATAHNEGFSGTIQIPEHQRTSSRKIRVKRSSIATQRVRTGTLKVKGKTHTVQAHSRTVNLPKRQFIGNSRVLNQKLDIEVSKMIDNIGKP